MKPVKAAQTSHLLVARFDYQATEPHELSVSCGERLLLLDCSREWWLVQNGNGQSGYVPSNYVKRMKQSILTSIRSAFRDVLRRHENKDGFSQSFRFSAPGRRTKQQLATTRSDPNLSDATLFNRADWRNASFSANRSPSSVGAPKDVTARNVSVAKSAECESYSAGAFDTVVNARAGATRLATVLYTYVAQKNDELTLRRGDHVCVYETCVDGWWRVQYIGAQAQAAPQSQKLPFLTRIGWFPSNYLDLDTSGLLPADHSQSAISKSPSNSSNSPSLAKLQDGNTDQVLPITSVSQQQSGSPASNLHVDRHSLSEKDWYWASVRRADCERALARANGGSFIVRDCESSPGDLTIVVRRHDSDRAQSPSMQTQTQTQTQTANANMCRNFRVRYVAPKFAIGALKYDSIDALLDHYRRHPIFSAHNEKLFLGTPLSRERLAPSDLAQAQSRPTIALPSAELSKSNVSEANTSSERAFSN